MGSIDAAHAHTHTCTYKHVYIHAYTHVYIHAYTHEYTHAQETLRITGIVLKLIFVFAGGVVIE